MLVRQVQAILVHPGSSVQLAWELAFVLRSGQAGKLFLIIGPLTFAASFLKNLQRRMKGRQWQPRWADVHRHLQQAGYQIPQGFGVSSAVIGFDAQGCATLVHCEFEADAFVLAIKDHLAKHRRS